MARIADVPDREYVKLGGTVKQVALAPRAGTPTLEASLYDGTGSVTLVWLGRRRMAGVDPGADGSRRTGLRAQRPARHLQPAYELQA